METMSGFIKLHRKILDWEWYGDPYTKLVFLHLLLTANYKETKYRGVTIEPGQTVIGRKALADTLGISERNVRTALNHLKSTNEIAIRTTNKFSVVTVVNWELYQCQLGEVTNKVTNKLTSDRPTSDQQVTTPKEYKNKRTKEDKNIPNSNKAIYSREMDEIIDYLNEVCGTRYRSSGRKTRDLIQARMNEGFTVEDFKTVIYKKAKQWRDDPKMCKFLRPETLFGNKFEGYLNEKSAVSAVERWDAI